MLVMGFGMGTGMSLYSLIVQNALPTKIGQATATLTFFRSIAGTIGLAAMGSVMNAVYLPAFQSVLPTDVKQAVPAKVLAAFSNPQALLSPDALAQLRTALASQGSTLFNYVTEAMREGLVQSLHDVFSVNALLLAIGLLAVCFLPEIELRGGPVTSKVDEGIEEEVPMAAG